MADKCKTYRAEIEEAGGRALGGAAGAHLEECQACAGLRRKQESLAALVGGLGRVSAPDDFEFRLRARMAARRGVERRPLPWLRFAPGFTAFALAACFLVFAAALYLKTRPSAGEHTPAQQASAVTPSAQDESPKAPVSAAVNKNENATAPTAATPAAVEKRKSRAAAAVSEVAERKGSDKPRRGVDEASYGVKGAAVIEGPNSKGAGKLASHPASQVVQLRTSPETLRVLMRDGRGAARVLPMRSVSFGALELVGRNTRNARAAVTDKEGVW